MMKGAFAGALVKGQRLRTIADQVEALLIFQYAPNAAAEIVVIANRDAAGFVREIIETFLVIKGFVAPLIGSLLHLLLITSCEIVGGGELKRLQTRRVHRV